MSRNGYDLHRGERPRAWQQTLKSQINCSGTGLHSGAQVSLTLYPAPANTGIVFRRSDLAGAPEIQALWHNVVDTQLCTTLGDGNGVFLETEDRGMSIGSHPRHAGALVDVTGEGDPDIALYDLPSTTLPSI